MDKNEIVMILETVATPIYQIEENLGMPKTTLQKAIKGQRVLPKRWALRLLEAYPPKKQEVILPPIKEKQSTKNTELPEDEYNFEGMSILFMENFTKYPKKDAPTDKWKKIEWEKEKALADHEIRVAWNNYQKINKPTP